MINKMQKLVSDAFSWLKFTNCEETFNGMIDSPTDTNSAMVDVRVLRRISDRLLPKLVTIKISDVS